MNGLNHKFCMTDFYKRAILSLAKYESEQTPVFHKVVKFCNTYLIHLP